MDKRKGNYVHTIGNSIGRNAQDTLELPTQGEFQQQEQRGVTKTCLIEFSKGIQELMYMQIFLPYDILTLMIIV